MCRKNILIHLLLAILIACVLSGCAPPIIGAPSFTLLTDNSADRNFTQISNEVEESDCFTWFLLFAMSGKMEPSTEGLVSRTLEKYKADVLLKTELTASGGGIPYIYMRMCQNLKGIPAKYVAGGVK